MNAMNAMPRMPKLSAVTHNCKCGCGQPTKRVWASGHDGRATGWALRVERNVIKLTDVPSNEVNGAIHMMLTRATSTTATQATGTHGK